MYLENLGLGIVVPTLSETWETIEDQEPPEGSTDSAPNFLI